MKHPAVFALLLSCGLCVVARAGAGEESIELEEAPGRDLTATQCVLCHSLDYIPMNAAVLDRAGWRKTVQKMIDRFGAPVSKDEAERIVQYLGAAYSRPADRAE